MDEARLPSFATLMHEKEKEKDGESTRYQTGRWMSNHKA
ncbi:hypothetical protein T4D_15996 [Trichinella pseudospiralis]|uniref:Uncharacterized protein n=1 Tax=Trichinella pseudospiralis TaxID=6337 RepID=A0A0V1FTI4_TRIPS|nr:hypothetical protein T4D_15996 [Trichinella pseudospiralis]